MTNRPARVLAGVAIVLLGAGDVFRYTMGYPGWGALCGVVLVAAAVVLVRARPRLASAPAAVGLLLALMALSCIWALSPAASALAVALQLATALAGLLLAMLEPERLLTLLHGCLQGILVASLAFELAVATLVGGRLYPPVPLPGADYSGDDVPAALAWSRGLLLEGGRIQGIVGNANLLAMLALLALVLAGALALSRRTRAWPAWVALPIVVLALTRSATVLVAAVLVAVVAVALVAWRRLSRRAFAIAAASVGALGVAGGVAVVVLREQVLSAIGRDADLTGRLQIWQAVAELWLRSPVVGTGWIGYWPPWVEPYGSLASQDGVRYLQAHSVVLDVLMQVGVVGLVVWIALQVSALRNAARWMRSAPAGDAALRAAPLLLLVALLAQGLAESRPLIELGFALLIAFALGLARHERLVGPARVDAA